MAEKEEALKNQIKAQLKTEEDELEEAPRPGFLQRAKRSDLAGFLREFSILVGGNYTLSRALEVLSKGISNKDLAASIKKISESVGAGISLSKAMAPYPWYFDTVATSIIKAAEESAKLEEGLEHIANMLEQEVELKAKIGDALAYPLLLLLATGAAFMVLILFVVPTFESYIFEAGGTIEGLSGAVFGFSTFVRVHFGWLWILLLSALITYAFVTWKQRNPLSFDIALGKVPIVGSMMLKSSICRFTGNLSMLIQNEVPLTTSLDLCKTIVGNAYLQQAIDEMHVAVTEGKTMGEILQKYDRLPPVVVDMITIGEESGRLEEMLKFLFDFIKADLLRQTSRLSVLLQPLMMAVSGIFLILVLLSFFYPYFDILTSLTKVR